MYRCKRHFRELYLKLRAIAKSIDSLLIRITSFGRYFIAKKTSVTSEESDPSQIAAVLLEEDRAAFARYNESTNPTIALRVYTKVKSILRGQVAKIKPLVKGFLK